jgi:thiol-disulfide isomerase/thioredoxin
MIRSLILAVAALGSAAATAAETEWRLVDPRLGRPAVLEPSPLSHVVFFATWCPACVAELDRLAEMEARFGGRGYRLSLVAVAARHTPERLVQFANERRPPGRLLFDPTGAAQEKLRVEHLPLHVLLDASGRELARSGALDEAFQAAVTQALERPAARKP